jgi:hypothetical protein
MLVVLKVYLHCDDDKFTILNLSVKNRVIIGGKAYDLTQNSNGCSVGSVKQKRRNKSACPDVCALS